GPQCHIRVLLWRDIRENRRSLRSQCADRAFPARGSSQGRETAKAQAHACTLHCRHPYRSTCCAIEGSNPGPRLRRFVSQVLWALSFEPPEPMRTLRQGWDAHPAHSSLLCLLRSLRYSLTSATTATTWWKTRSVSSIASPAGSATPG